MAVVFSQTKEYIFTHYINKRKMFLPWNAAECKSYKLIPRRMSQISGGCFHSLLLNMKIQMQNIS